MPLGEACASVLTITPSPRTTPPERPSAWNVTNTSRPSVATPIALFTCSGAELGRPPAMGTAQSAASISYSVQ